MNSCSGFSRILVIDRRDGHRVQLFVLAVTLLALAAVWRAGLTPWMHAVAVTLVCIAGLRALYRASHRFPGRVARLEFAGDGRLLLELGANPGRLIAAKVANAWRLPGAIGITFDGKGIRHADAIFFRDCMAPGDWRRLVVRLRLGARADR